MRVKKGERYVHTTGSHVCEVLYLIKATALDPELFDVEPVARHFKLTNVSEDAQCEEDDLPDTEIAVVFRIVAEGTFCGGRDNWACTLDQFKELYDRGGTCFAGCVCPWCGNDKADGFMILTMHNSDGVHCGVMCSSCDARGPYAPTAGDALIAYKKRKA